MSRKIDGLFRVVIPKELRKKCSFSTGTTVIFREEKGEIIITRAKCFCKICSLELDQASELPLCKKCISAIQSFGDNLNI